MSMTPVWGHWHQLDSLIFPISNTSSPSESYEPAGVGPTSNTSSPFSQAHPSPTHRLKCVQMPSHAVMERAPCETECVKMQSHAVMERAPCDRECVKMPSHAVMERAPVLSFSKACYVSYAFRWVADVSRSRVTAEFADHFAFWTAICAHHPNSNGWKNKTI